MGDRELESRRFALTVTLREFGPDIGLFVVRTEHDDVKISIFFVFCFNIFELGFVYVL